MHHNLLGSSVHGIFQARVLEWVAISFSRGSSRHRDGTWISCTADRRFTVWVTRKAGGHVGRAGALSTSSFMGRTPRSGVGYPLPLSPPCLCVSPSVHVSLLASPSLPSCLCVSLPVCPHFLLSFSVSLPPCLSPTLHISFQLSFRVRVSLRLSPPSSLGLLASFSLQVCPCLSVTPTFFLSVPRLHHLSPYVSGQPKTSSGPWSRPSDRTSSARSSCQLWARIFCQMAHTSIPPHSVQVLR